MTELAELLVAAGDTYGDKIAVRDGRGTWTYRELSQYSLSMAAWLLQEGVGPGDRVLVRATSTRKAVATIYGCVIAGAACVPVNPAMRPFHLAHVVADTEPRLGIGTAPNQPGRLWRDLATLWPEVETTPAVTDPCANVTNTSTAFLLYTSGSTGMPKAVVSPHSTVMFAARAVLECLRYRHDDTVFCRIPLSFDYGLYQLLLCVLSGADIVLSEPGREARTLLEISESGATVVPLVPSLARMLVGLASRATQASAVRLFTNTGEELPAATLADLRRYFPAAAVQTMFGTTECKRASIMEPDGDLRRPGSVGRPLPGTTVEIHDQGGQPVSPAVVGEITVRGPHVMAGYWRRPDATVHTFRRNPNGETTLHTGDYGFVDGDGYLYFVGRRDTIFKRNGTRTSTTEIEFAAMDIPGVTGAVVLPPTRERDAILLVTGSVMPGDALRELQLRLEPSKVLSDCRRLESFPHTANGKVDRVRLAATLSAEAENADV